MHAFSIDLARWTFKLRLGRPPAFERQVRLKDETDTETTGKSFTEFLGDTLQFSVSLINRNKKPTSNRGDPSIKKHPLPSIGGGCLKGLNLACD